MYKFASEPGTAGVVADQDYNAMACEAVAHGLVSVQGRGTPASGGPHVSMRRVEHSDLLRRKFLRGSCGNTAMQHLVWHRKRIQSIAMYSKLSASLTVAVQHPGACLLAVRKL